MKKNERLPRLDWQSELDETMADIDLRLTHPRRRASDRGPQPPLPGLGEVHLTPEMMDEIAWRVAERVRRTAPAVPAQPAHAAETAIEPAPENEPGLRPGKLLMVRYRMPVLPWPFRLLQRRRRQHPLTTAKLRA